MLAATITHADPDDPLAGLQVTERPEPTAPDGWRVVDVQAASLNHHDLWALRGWSPPGAPLPRVLGSDAACVDDAGRPVVVHALVGDPTWTGDEDLDPRVTMLSDGPDGTLAARVAVPTRNLVPLPPGLSFDEAACLPTAWLTAYRMLVTLGGVGPESTVLVQGAGGGIATAAVALGRAAGARVWVTSRDEHKREQALRLGADAAVPTGSRLPGRADVVLETVGAATWEHSMKAVRPGGTIVVAGMTSGSLPPLDLHRVFMAKLRILGTTMGTRDELAALVRFCADHGIHPQVAQTLPLDRVHDGFDAMARGRQFGKIVVRP